MTDLSITVEAMFGLNWERWHPLVQAAEESGLAGLYRSDHFVFTNGPDQDALELIVSLVSAAERSSRIRLGPLVSPISFRDPRHLLRQAVAIDDLSGGRMILGVGTGWMQREHEMFGYELGDLDHRFRRFEEALVLMHGLLRSEHPLSMEGAFYQLKDVVLLPRPQRPGGPRLMVGGNGLKRTLPMAARYADVWNGYYLTADDYALRNRRLDELLDEEGRRTDEVFRSVMLPCIVGRDESELAASAAWINLEEEMKGLSPQQTIERFQSLYSPSLIHGAPEQVVDQLQPYIEAGAQEIILQWGVGFVEGVHMLAEEVMPHL